MEPLDTVADDRAAMVREKMRAARASVIASALLTGMKLAAGLLTGSLGILAEAAHSALDFGAAAMTMFAVRTSWKPPDREHHYGHGKIENLTALGEALLLVLTSVWILIEAAERLAGHGPEVEASVWGFVVIGISILVDIVRSRDLARVAKASGSQALEADALHFSTDIASSAVVIVGLFGVWLADRIDIPALKLTDAGAASVVAIIVLLLSIRLGRRAADMLLDRAPAGLADEVEAAAAGDGITSVQEVRLRQAGDQYFADITICIDPALPIAEAERVTEGVRERTCAVLGRETHVAVQVVGQADAPPSLRDQVATAVAMTGVQAHDITLRRTDDGIHADFHIELPGRISLREGHAVADQIENRVKAEVAGVARVEIHLEQHEEQPEAATPLAEEAQRQLAERARRAAERVAGITGLHAFEAVETRAGLFISCHCLVRPDTSLSDAHARTDELEAALRAAIPEAARIVIHAEPEGDAPDR